MLYNVIPDVFMGCWSCDNIPEKKCMKKGNFCIIVNLSPAGTKGSHFISIAKKRHKVIVFDPLYHKLSWLPIPIINFINKICRKQIWTPYNQAVQSQQSTYCGFFTSCELLQTFLKVSKLKQYKRRQLKRNDKICIDNIMHMIKYCT